MKSTYLKAKKKVFGAGGVRGRYDPRRVGAVKSLTNLAKDVKMIQERLNVEKKFVTLHNLDSGLGMGIGQVAGNFDGAAAPSVSPLVNEGTGSDERTGAQVRFTGISMRLQLSGQTACDAGLKAHVYLLRVPAAWSVSDTIARFMNPDPISDHRDTNSFRNLDFMREIKIMGKKKISLPARSHATADPQVRDYSFNFKVDEKTRYADGNNVPLEYQYRLLVVAD